MLWKKESNGVDALYVNIFDKFKSSMQDIVGKQQQSVKPIPKKSDLISMQKRTEGNGLFAKQVVMTEAMEKYNESLCYAESGSQNISLAYANRSASLFHKEKFKESLVDIELAKKSGYPQHLMLKLDQRKAECLKRIEEGMQMDRFDAKLAFEPDEKFPCMANVLKAEKDTDGNYSVVAKEDIDVGKMIVVEKAYVTYLGRNYLKCNICLKGNANLVPCTKCTTAMFCSAECQGNPLHDFECGMKYADNTQQNVNVMKIVRSIFLATDMFSSVDELMNFVEEAIQSGPNKLEDNLLEPKSQYRMFLKQNLRGDFAKDKDCLAMTFRAFYFIKKMPKFDTMFKSLKYRRFLLHLIGHHVHITNTNEFCYRSFNWTGGPMPDLNQMVVYSQTNLVGRYFPHSCNPNVAGFFSDGSGIWFSIRPIKKGEQLFESLIDFHGLLLSTGQRQQELRELEAKCNCARCTGAIGAIASQAYRKQITSDPDFLAVLVLDINTSCPNHKNMPQAIDKCIEFLRKYARNQWCDEVGTVMKIYWEYLCQILKNM